MDEKRINFDKGPPPPRRTGPGRPSVRSPENSQSVINARVLRAADWRNSWAGLAEEALLAKRSGKPIYLAGGFGGCTRALINALLGQKPGSTQSQYRERRIPGDGRSGTIRFLAWTLSTDTGLVGEFEVLGDRGALQGQRPDRGGHRRLFETPHVIEMVCLDPPACSGSSDRPTS